MKNIISSFLMIMLVSINGFSQRIDSENSVVNFEIANLKFSSVEGTFKGMNGKVFFDAQNPSDSRFSVCIDVNTVNTGNEERDHHLLNEDFFNAPKFPSICYEATSVSKSGSDYIMTGKMTIVGVTKEVKLPFTVDQQDNKTILESEIVLNRFDYNLAVKEYSSTFMVGDEVELKIKCVLIN